jgi:mono/diheme cytochrome c family protein
MTEDHGEQVAGSGEGRPPEAATTLETPPPRARRSRKRLALRILLVLVGLFALAQAIPYGRDHTNPPAVAEPNWDSARTRQLAVTACFDCHSNETKWPWYTNVAPVSWLVQSDVNGGRGALNFSEWGGNREVADVVDAVRSGDMPPLQYTLIHGNARLSGSEKAALADGLQKTLARPGTTPPPPGG